MAIATKSPGGRGVTLFGGSPLGLLQREKAAGRRPAQTGRRGKENERGRGEKKEELEQETEDNKEGKGQ